MARIKEMTSGKPLPLLVLFALPLMLGNVFQQMYTVVDTAIVGKALGVDALAALGAVDWLNWMIIGMVQGLTQGFSIRMAKEFGARQYDKLKKTVATAVILSAFAALLLVAIGQLLCKGVLQLLQTPERILPMSLLYLRIIFAGIPIVTAYNLLSAMLRALGDGKTPLYAMVAASITNIVLDLVFVLVFHWGIAGAAAATLIGQLVSCIFCLSQLRKVEILRLAKSDFGELSALSGKLLALGTPMALQNCIIAIGGIIIQLVVNGFGVIFIAGFTAANKLFGLLEMAGASYGFAVVTYVGQNLGAKKTERIRKGVNSAALLALLTSIVIGLIMLIAGKLILSCFISGTPEEYEGAMKVAYQYLATMSIALPSLYFIHVYRSALQGMGDTVQPMISGILELVIRVSLVFILPAIVGSIGVFLAEVAAWIGAAIMQMIVYYLRIHRMLKKEAV